MKEAKIRVTREGETQQFNGTTEDLPDGVRLFYEDKAQGSSTQMTLFFGEPKAEILQKGALSYALTLKEGKRGRVTVSTPYGEMEFPHETHRVTTRVTPSELRVRLDYTLGEGEGEQRFRLFFRVNGVEKG